MSHKKKQNRQLCVQLIVAYLLHVPMLVAADSVASEPVMISIYLDNDLFTGNSKDGDYTGGGAVTFSGKDASLHPFSIDRPLSWLNKAFGSDHLLGEQGASGAQTFHSCEVGLAAFTPTAIEAQNPILNDRPYSSLIYLSNTQQNISADQRRSVISSLSIGALGLPLAGEIQNSIHSLIGSETADGWEHQISKGGEPTLKYSTMLQQYLNTGLDNIQATASVGLSLGYLTEATAGISIRTGVIHTPPWSFNVHNSNYGEKSNITVPTTQVLDEFYFLAGANIKARAYNAFLQGQFRESAVTYSSNEVEPLIYEGWIGFGCEFKSGLRLSYLFRHQSSELKTGLGDRSFTFAEFITSYKY